MKNMNKLVQCGNMKLPKTTMIFNMCSATACPAAKLGFCKVRKKCYALKAERVYPQVLPYRTRQEKYWNGTDVSVIIDDFSGYIRSKRIKITHFRFNESGDINSIADVEKLLKIAQSLYKQFKIITYGYTARYDIMSEYLKNHTLPKYLIIKTSGYEISETKSTCVIKKGEAVPENYKLCPVKGCMIKCKMCIKHINVAFREH